MPKPSPKPKAAPEPKAKKTPREDLTIKEFCGLHSACGPGRKWALASCETMQDVWDKASPEYLFWIASRPDVLSCLELRRFLLACAELAKPAADDPRSLAVLPLARRWVAEGSADALDAEELQRVRSEARATMESLGRVFDEQVSPCSYNAEEFAIRCRQNAAWCAASVLFLVLGSDAHLPHYVWLAAGRAVSAVTTTIEPSPKRRAHEELLTLQLARRLRENCAPDFTRKEDRNGDPA